MDKFLRIFDRQHNILDELDGYDNLTYGWTLNDADTLDFQLSISDPKRTPVNMQYFNHIEIVRNSDNVAVWGGIIAGHDYNDSKVKINCLSYEALLKFRRLRAKSYGTMDYGSLTAQMIADANAISQTGVSIGTIATGALQTTREVKATDMLLAKIKDLNADGNYDWDIGANRAYNFHLRKGADKPDCVITWGGDADNIIAAPERAEDIMSMANSVYSESTADSETLTSLANDSASQGAYGMVEGVYSSNSGISVQSTLDTYANSSLQCSAYPSNSFTVKIKDSSLCPFAGLIVGDALTVRLIPYDNFSALMRIVRMVHDELHNTRDITFGTVLYRPQPPIKRLYKHWGDAR